MNCQHCQPLLLDHLYGLLDGPQDEAVRAHLLTCSECAAAGAETARVQGLFAQAAKSTFPGTRFEPPAPAPHKAAPSPAAPRVAARAGRSGGGFGRRVTGLVPWAVAAAVVLAVPGTIVPVLTVFDRADRARHQAEAAKLDADAAVLTAALSREEREKGLNGARLKLASAEQARSALVERWFAEQKAATAAVANRRLVIDVHKPAAVQPGAPNDFLVVLREDYRAQWERGTRLVAEVRSSDAVLFTQALDHQRQGHEHPIRLPASVWTLVKPDAELTLVVAQIDDKTQERTALQEVRLAGPVYATLLVTDKPTYRPGERLFFRSLTLDRVTLRPPAHEQALRFQLVSGTTLRPVPELMAEGTTDLVRVGPEGRVEPVRAADGQPVRGVGCGEFVLPANLRDGEYALVLTEPPNPSGPAPTVPLPVARTIKVRSGAAEAFAKQVGFARASFAPGDSVEAWAELKFQDRPVAGADVTRAAIVVDGVPLKGVTASPKTDAAGRARVQFTLPPNVLNGDVQLKLAFRANGREELVSDRVPVVGRRLLVEFFPEGGDNLVAGVPCKVYVRATTPGGRPVDIRGTVTDGRDTLATVETLADGGERGANRGLAAFTYTPQAGTPVWLKLESPSDTYALIMPAAPVYSAMAVALGGPGAVTAGRTGFPLPEPKLDGVVLSVPDESVVTAPGRPIRVRLHSAGQPRALVVGAYVRGRLADTQKVTVEPGQMAEVKLMAGADARGGVVRVTAFEELPAKDGTDRPDLKPVAERLVFRRPGEVLNLALNVRRADGSVGGPVAGAPVACSVTATDEKNAPAAAVLWAAVTGTGVAPGARDRSMPTHFLLAGDVRDPEELEYADFLLTDHPKAAPALDLVLGTQGWRRFAEQAPVPFAGYGKRGALANQANPGQQGNGVNQANLPDLVRLSLQNGQFPVVAEPTAVRDVRKIAETYAPLHEVTVQAVARARAELEALERQTPRPGAAHPTDEEAGAAKRRADDLAARAAEARGPVDRFRSAAWFGVAGFAALALLCGGAALVRPPSRLPLGVSTVGSFGLAAFLFVAAGWGDEARGGEARKTAGVATPAGAKSAKSAEKGPTAEMAALGATDGPQKQEMEKSSALAPTATPAAAMPAAGGIAAADDKSDAPPGAPGGPGGRDGRPDRGPTSFGGGLAGGAGSGGRAPAPPTGLPPLAGGGRGPLPTLPTRPPFPPFPHPTYNLFSPGGPDLSKLEGFGGQPLPAPLLKVGPTAAAPLSAPPGVLGTAPGGAPKSANGFADDKRKGGPDDRSVEALRRASESAAKFADERRQGLDAAIEQQLGGRVLGKGRAAGPKPVGDLLERAEVEALALEQMRGAISPRPPLVVREYAAPRPAAARFADQPEDPDTILWQPVIVLPSDGKAVLTFTLGNAPGGYRVLVAGHTADGRLGEARTVIETFPAVPVVPVAPAAPPGR